MEPINGEGHSTLQIRLAKPSPFDGFKGAAEALITGVEPLRSHLPQTAWPLTFIAGQIVENAPKAFLAKQGASEDELRRAFGHDILALWTKAVDSGFVYGNNQPIWLQRLAELHSGSYMIRYPMGVHAVVLPQCEQMAVDLPALLVAALN